MPAFDLWWGKWKLAFIAISLQIFWQTFYRTIPRVVLYQTYPFCPNLWIWLVAMAIETLNLPLLMRFRCYGNSNFHWLIMGQVKFALYCYVTADNLSMKTLSCHSNGSAWAMAKAFWLPIVISVNLLSSPLSKTFLSKPLNLIGCHGNRKAKFDKNIQKSS